MERSPRRPGRILSSIAAAAVVAGFSGQGRAEAPYAALTWDADIHFPAGGYRAGKLIDLNGEFTITVDPGAVLDGIELKSSKAGQHWKVAGAFFRNVNIAGELGVSLDATDSVFEHCLFLKGGGWFVDRWGSKWRFTNCVITRSLFPPALEIANYSVVAKDCTFIGVKLPTIELKKDYDYFQGKNLRFENCRFVQCVIPVTFLAATVNGVFEQCVFPAERVAWPAAMGPLTVNAFFAGPGAAPRSFQQGPVNVVFTPAAKENGAGSRLEFTQIGGAVTSKANPMPNPFTQIATLRKKKASEISAGP